MQGHNKWKAAQESESLKNHGFINKFYTAAAVKYASFLEWK